MFALVYFNPQLSDLFFSLSHRHFLNFQKSIKLSKYYVELIESLLIKYKIFLYIKKNEINIHLFNPIYLTLIHNSLYSNTEKLISLNADELF